MHIKTSDQEAFSIGFGDYTCNWGVHMCGLYETADERDEIQFGCLRAGFLDGDLQLYCLTQRTPAEFIEKFTCFCPTATDSLQNAQHFYLPSAQELYYPNGFFSPWETEAGLGRFYRQAQQWGRMHIRATAEMDWALADVPGSELLMVYESRLNYFIPGKPWLSICLYDINRFSGLQIMNVLRTHPFIISKGIINQNPYYIHPDRWLAENAPEYLHTTALRMPSG